MVCLCEVFGFLVVLCLFEVPRIFSGKIYPGVRDQSNVTPCLVSFFQSKAVKNNAFIVNKARIMYLLTLSILPKRPKFGSSNMPHDV